MRKFYLLRMVKFDVMCVNVMNFIIVFYVMKCILFIDDVHVRNLWNILWICVMIYGCFLLFFFYMLIFVCDFIKLSVYELCIFILMWYDIVWYWYTEYIECLNDNDLIFDFVFFIWFVMEIFWLIMNLIDMMSIINWLLLIFWYM